MGKDKKELNAPTVFKFTSVSTKVLLSWDTDRSSLPGGDYHMKGAGMLVVSITGVNFGFWSYLGCSGQNAIILSRKGLLGLHVKKYKKLNIFNSFY